MSSTHSVQCQLLSGTSIYQGNDNTWYCTPPLATGIMHHHHWQQSTGITYHHHQWQLVSCTTTTGNSQLVSHTTTTNGNWYHAPPPLATVNWYHIPPPPMATGIMHHHHWQQSTGITYHHHQWQWVLHTNTLVFKVVINKVSNRRHVSVHRGPGAERVLPLAGGPSQAQNSQYIY